MNRLDELENRTIYIIREAYARFRNAALLWSAGKDSTALLWIARKAFFGKIPFSVVHIDTGFKLHQIYEFRDKYAREWGLNLVITRNEAAIEQGMNPGNGRFKCCTTLKTETLKTAIREHGFEALLLAIRRDEHGIRAKERYFSPRSADFRWDYENQPAELWDLYASRHEEEQHLRIHPMLHWTEMDVWRYAQRENIPVLDLYFSDGGTRYRSIGCESCCEPVDSDASTIGEIIRELETTKAAERAGRAQDKEDAYGMQKLRALGYM